MRKLKFFLDFDKEERWLNRLAAQGHLLSKAAFATYTFTEIEPGTAVVRVDYRPSMSEADYADYVTLFADSGWQHLSGSRKAGAHYKGGAQYFASFDADPDADIFSDAHSRAGRYRLSITALSTLGFLLLLFCVATQAAGASLLPPPHDWYQTPGLWDKHGMDFVGSFLFETVFVVLPRVGAGAILVIFTVLCLGGAVYQWALYRSRTSPRR